MLLCVAAKAKYLDVIIEGSNKYSVYLTISETGRIACEYYDIYGRLSKTAQIKNYSSFNEASFENINQMPSGAQLVITSRYVYDDLDRVTEQYDGESRPTCYTYDSMGNVINMVQGTADSDSPQVNISYEYDSAGNVTKMTHGTHVTTYEYDYAGRMTKLTDPMGYTETYTYDSAGNVKTAKDKNGVTTTNTYNSRGLLSKTAKNGEYIEYTYNGTGSPLTINDKNGTITYTYNYDGTPASKSCPDGKSITYSAYNGNKALTSMTDYLGNTTTYTYNPRGLVTAVGEKYSGTSTTNTTQYAYNADGSLQKVTYPLSSYTTAAYTYDYAGRVSNITNKLTSSTTYSTHAYTYDNSGNVTQKIDTIQGTAKTTNYTYDSVNRLIGEQINGTNIPYSYDEYGNMTVSNIDSAFYTYDANNRLIKIHEPGTPHDTTDGSIMSMDWDTFLEYDNNGNLKKTTTKEMDGAYTGSTVTYEYDTWGRLTSYSDNLHETASYSYYADGLRKSKTVGSDTTKYYYDGDNVINETKNGADYATNVMGANGYVSRKQNGTTGYLFKDAHGDVLAAYSSTSNKLADYTYNAWGEARTENETSSFANNPLRYCGEYYDYESGMTYLRARYYNSTIKRFITEDPAKDGVNWYSYANNNPVTFVDPSGLYDRKAAVDFATFYSVNGYMYEYTGHIRFSQDCTAFVSNCLKAGGLQQSDDWYFYNAFVAMVPFSTKRCVYGSYSRTWSVSNDQYEVFSNKSGNYTDRYSYDDEEICIHESRWIADSIEKYNIQPGDLLYFQNPDTGEKEHTAIIVSTENGRITYAQHDDNYDSRDLGEYLDTHTDPHEYNYVFVVRIRDDA